MTDAVIPEVKGVPSGLTAEPINGSAATVKGVPAGLVAEPIASAKTEPEKVQGVPDGVTAHPLLPNESRILKTSSQDISQDPNQWKPSPRDQVYASTIAEGQTADRAKQRVAEYDRAIGAGFSPDKATKYASTKQFDDQPKVKLSEQEKQGIAQAQLKRYAEVKAKFDAGRADVTNDDMADMGRFGRNPEMAAKKYADAYAYARAQGWTEPEAQEYANGSSLILGQAGVRAEKALGRTLRSVSDRFDWGLYLHGHKPWGVADRIGNPLAISEESNRELELAESGGALTGGLVARATNNSAAGFRVASWMNKGDSKAARMASSLDSHLAHFIGGMLTPQNIVLMATTKGLGAFEGRAATEALEVEEADKVLPVSVQKIAMTTQSLAHAGFTLQMAQGTAEATKAAGQSWAKGEKSEAVGYMLDALTSGVMTYGGLHEMEAHAQIKADLDATTRAMYGSPQVEGEGPTQKAATKFGELNDYQQAAVITKMIEDSPEYKEAADATNKNAERSAKKLAYKHSRALAEAWNPSAAARTIRTIHDQRVEGEREDARQAHLSQLVDVIKQNVERQQKVAADVAESRERVREGREDHEVAQRMNVEGDPRPLNIEEDSQTGERSYAGDYLGEQNNFGVVEEGGRHFVYRRTPDRLEWLRATGDFGIDPEDRYSSDSEQGADTLARVSSLSLPAIDAAQADGATEDAKADARLLYGVRRDLATGEITPEEAQRRANIASEEARYTVYDAAREGKLNGAYADGGRDAARRDMEQGLVDAGVSPEDARKILDEQEAVNVNEAISNLHHVAMPGDQITVKGATWTLDDKGNLRSERGRTVPLMRGGLYTPQAIQMALYGRVGYGVEDVRARQERIEGDATAEQAVSRADAALEDGNYYGPTETQQRKKSREERMARAIPRNFGERESPEGEQGPEPQTEQALLDVIMATVDPRFIANPEAAANIVRQEAEKSGLTPMQVALKKLGMEDTPRGKIANLKPGDQVLQNGRREPWTVHANEKGGLSLRSGGARLELDPANPSKWVVDMVGKGKVVPTDSSGSDLMREAAYGPAYVENQERSVEDVRARQEAPEEPPQTQEEAEARAWGAEQNAHDSQAVAVRAMTAVGAVTTEAGIPAAVDKAESAITDAQHAATQLAEAKGNAVEPNEYPQRAPINGRVGAMRNGKPLIGNVRVNKEAYPVRYMTVNPGSIVTSHVWDGTEAVENPTYGTDEASKGMQARTFNAEKAKALAASAEVGEFVPDLYTDRGESALVGPSILEPGGRVVGGNRRMLRLLRYIENLNRIADIDRREVLLADLRDKLNQYGISVGIEPSYTDEIEIPVRALEDVTVDGETRPAISTMQDAVRYGELLNKHVGEEISDQAHGVALSKLLSPAQIGEISEKVSKWGSVSEAVAKEPGYFVNLAKGTLLVQEGERGWFENNGYGDPTLSRTGIDKLEDILMGRILRDPSVLVGLTDERTDRPIRAYRATVAAVGRIVKMQSIPERDITGKVEQALVSSALTHKVNPDRAKSGDRWDAVYAPTQKGMYGDPIPTEPDRVVEAIWRAQNKPSNAEYPRSLSGPLEEFLMGRKAAAMNLPFGEDHEGPPTYELPHEAFNNAFRDELKEVQRARNARGLEYGDWALTEDEYNAAVTENRELSDAERKESEQPKQAQKEGRKESTEQPAAAAEAKPPAGRMERTPSKKEAQKKSAEDTLARKKKTQGHVTIADIEQFLEPFATSKAEARDAIRVAGLLAKHAYDLGILQLSEEARAQAPEITPEKALEWLFKERFAGMEATGERRDARGEFSEPTIEGGWAKGILRMHQGADMSTWIHEVAHATFPFLDEEALRAVNSMTGPGPKWDGTKEGMKNPEVRRALNEKWAHGNELALRDENLAGFDEGQRKVLGRTKELFKRLYKDLITDPLSAFKLSKQAKILYGEVFGFDPEMDAREAREKKLKKMQAEENKMKPPSKDDPLPVQKMLADAGAIGPLSNSHGLDAIRVPEYETDPPVMQNKPITVAYFATSTDAIGMYQKANTTGSLMTAARVLQYPDGRWAVEFNTEKPLPRTVYQQGLRETDIDRRLENLKEELSKLKEWQVGQRTVKELQIKTLMNAIRAKAGVEPLRDMSDPELPKKVAQEIRDAKTADRARAGNDVVSGVRNTERIGRVPERAVVGVSDTARPGGRGFGSGRPVAPQIKAMRVVTPVVLEPMEGGMPALPSKEWSDAARAGGLSGDTPQSDWKLSSNVETILKMPGQKQSVQVAMSALERGDGVVMANQTGTGKTHLAMAIASEFGKMREDPLVLYLSKNRTLLEKAKRVGKNSFGLTLNLEAPDVGAKSGKYAVSYQEALKNSLYKNIKWDLVIADEAGEARNWFKDKKEGGMNQGQMLKAIIDNADKAVYMSATPFHSPMEYGYLEKLNLWPKGKFEDWVKQNFEHKVVGEKIVAKLDPVKQAKLREQLIERGQLVSQAVSYDGFNAHFGVVPVTPEMIFGLDRIREGFARTRAAFLRRGSESMAKNTGALEATFTKAYVEREKLPQAIELANQFVDSGYQVVIVSETNNEDLFHRERDGKPSTYQELDDATGGQLSKVLPNYKDVYQTLQAEFGDRVGDYSGRENTLSERNSARDKFLRGEMPILYATHGSLLGVDLHDGDYPELGVKGGDKPRVMIVLGPPYSGMLLEQVLGRLWRFGVKSDVHTVFLASDSEPDVQLMKQKVAPRMSALRAAVHGEKDSLASAMATYTSEEKIRARQDALAYSEGNKVKVDASSFAVRSKSRDVGISDWSAIKLPPATSAMRKGMKYGEEVPGGDWSTLYQSKYGMPRPPDGFEDAAGKRTIDEIANNVATGGGGPEELQNLEPAERETVVGAASAVASEEVERPGLDRDKQAVARQTMESKLRNLVGYIDTTGFVFDQETAIKAIASQAGVREVGNELIRMERGFQADYDTGRAQRWQMAEDIFKRYGLKPTPETLEEMRLVVEGHKAAAEENMAQAVEDMRDLMGIQRSDLADAGASVKHKGEDGKQVETFYRDMQDDQHFFARRIDWDKKLTDPETGKEHTLRELIKDKQDERIRQRVLDSVPELKLYGHERVYQYLKSQDPKAPILSHIHRAREINFPFVKADMPTLIGYFDQVARAIAIENNFGHKLSKLNGEIKKIPNVAGRATVDSMFRVALEPQSWDDWTAKVYRAALTFEAASKLTFAAPKVMFHAVHIPLGMNGKIMPLAKAMTHLAIHPVETYRNAAYVGTIARQLSAADIFYGEETKGAVHQIFKKYGFEAAYKLVRVLAGESARVYMEQYAMRDLKRGGRAGAEARRLLKDTFLISDTALDQAQTTGRFSQDDLARAQTAFTNEVAWSDNPLQSPAAARMEINEFTPLHERAFKRAVRLTYALASFSLKSMSFVRNKLWEEVMVHHNPRPLMFMAIAAPIAGQLLQATSLGAHHLFRRSMEGLTGKKHEKDKWDEHWVEVAAELSNMYHHPISVEAAKFYVDSFTMGYGWDSVRTVVDPFMNLASGNKKALKEYRYMDADMAEHLVGPAFGDLWQVIEYEKTVGEIEAGHTSPERKKKKIMEARKRLATELVPALREVPYFEPPPKRRQ